MHFRMPRRTIVPIGACTLMLGLALPSAVTTAATGAANPAPAPAGPSPYAPHSKTVVPGITGAAARRADPPMSATKRWAELNAASHRAASHKTAAAGTIKPSLSSWSGADHNYWGAFPSQTVYGAQATQSLNPDTVLSSSSKDIIYSPTLDPSGLTCIEMSTIYFSGGDQVGAWNWCATSPGFAKVTAINASFLSTYTTTIDGQPFYSVQDVQTNPTTNSWTSYLYNYSTKAWDTFYTSANTSKLSNSGGGWDMNEVYTYYNTSTDEGSYCTQSYGANWETVNLQYQLSTGGSWVAATPSHNTMNVAYPSGEQVGCGDASYWLPTANSNWKVTNNQHSASEIIGAGSGKCVDTNDQVFANGTQEQIYTCHNGSGQEWTYNADGELTVDGGAYCLDATNYGTTNGTKIQLWKCNGTTNQEWTFSIHNAIVGIGSGKCLDVTNYGTTNGSPLQLWTCNDTTNQQWSWN
jgi:hypothetical protein